jgi:hypothetical protein
MIPKSQTGDIELIDRQFFASSFSYAVLTDLTISKVSLDTSLFPGAPSDAKVHQGFRDQHRVTSNTILTEVKNLISSKGATSVIAVSFPRDFWVGDTHP